MDSITSRRVRRVNLLNSFIDYIKEIGGAEVKSFNTTMFRQFIVNTNENYLLKLTLPINFRRGQPFLIYGQYLSDVDDFLRGK
jgi:hypothetical protein